jgi:hypothetical protein
MLDGLGAESARSQEPGSQNVKDTAARWSQSLPPAIWRSV